MPATLVVKFESLESIANLLTKTHDDLVAQVAALRRDVDVLLLGWQVDTDSRRAQLGFDTRLGQQVQALMDALAKIKAQLDSAAVDAHATEVRNVAVLD